MARASARWNDEAMRVWALGVLTVASAIVVGCGGDDSDPAAAGSGGAAGSAGAGGGAGGSGGSGGTGGGAGTGGTGGAAGGDCPGWQRIFEEPGTYSAVTAAGKDVFIFGLTGGKRFDGSVWSSVAGSPTVGMSARAWAFTPNDLWVTGKAMSHFDGTGWTQTTLAAAPGALFALDSSKLWAHAYTYKDAIFFWNGQGWSSIATPSNCSSLWARSTNEVYCSFTGHAARWDGTKWTDGPAGSQGTLAGISGKLVSFAAFRSGTTIPSFSATLWDGTSASIETETTPLTGSTEPLSIVRATASAGGEVWVALMLDPPGNLKDAATRFLRRGADGKWVAVDSCKGVKPRDFWLATDGTRYVVGHDTLDPGKAVVMKKN